MKNRISRTLAVLLIICLMATLAVPAFAATSATATIDYTKTGSITIFKYDFTSASEDGVWGTDSYISTGVYDQNVNDVLGNTDKTNALGGAENGTSNGYAIKGVEFSYLKVADFRTYSEIENGTAHIELLYGFANDDAVLEILGLTADNRYVAADVAGEEVYYYQSDVVIEALKAALTDAPTATKSALENYIADNGGSAMALTDEDGKSSVDGLELGLYLFVETKVPEMVVDTTNPWLVSLPMTTINGTNADNGGQEWMYDITLYPKNQTNVPTLEKTVREDKADTGANNDTDSITDGFAHTGTASAGDVLDYQIISTLPSITSEATYLTAYTFSDTLSPGITYNQNDVVLTWYKDAACTQEIASWTEDSGMFTVNYSAEALYNTMTIRMTEEGLAAINSSDEVWADDAVKSGYSDCTVRISYSATVNSDESLVLGDDGNPNEVVLSWIRTSSNYYDTLIDDAHIYSYGVDLTKAFSDNNGDFSKVNFVVKNTSDNYWVKAEQDTETGIYYVTDHVATEAEATVFVPTSTGKIMINGLEDDAYILTETQTDNSYSPREKPIEVVISVSETADNCDIYSNDVLGEVQTMEHKLLTASATVDDNAVTMTENNGSVNAMAALKVTNTKTTFDIPVTGDTSMLVLTSLGALMIVCSVFLLFVISKNKKKDNA